MLVMAVSEPRRGAAAVLLVAVSEPRRGAAVVL